MLTSTRLIKDLVKDFKRAKGHLPTSNEELLEHAAFLDEVYNMTWDDLLNTIL